MASQQFKLPEIADLNNRVTLQSLTDTSDGQGGAEEVWADVATLWAKLQPTSSRERNFSSQIQYQRTHVAWIRHRSDITSAMRILFDSRYFQIKGIRRPDEKKFFLVLDLEENQGT